MKKDLFAVLAAVVICVVFSTVSFSQNRNSITGFVFDDKRAPVSQVYVELQTDFYSTVGRIRTRGSGQFSFSGLPPGHYYLKVLTSGTPYEEQTQSVSLVPVSVIAGRGSVSEQVNFYLKIRKTSSQAAPARPAVVFAQDVPPEASNLYETALADLEAKNEAVAFDKLKRSIEIFPEYFLALDRLGNEYIAGGHYEAAAVLLMKALTINQRSSSSALGLGLALFRLHQPEKALEQFEKVVSLDPSSPNGYLWRGITLYEKKNYSDALDSLLKANDLTGGKVAEIHWQLARVYKEQNKFAKSADHLELYLKYKPEGQNNAEIKKAIATLREKNKRS